MVRRTCSGGEGEGEKRDLKTFGALFSVVVVLNPPDVYMETKKVQ